MEPAVFDTSQLLTHATISRFVLCSIKISQLENTEPESFPYYNLS